MGAGAVVPAQRRRLLAALLASIACWVGAPGHASRGAAPAAVGDPRPPESRALDGFFDDLEKRTFNYFWETTNPANGLVPDRYPSGSDASIAAVGFGLTAYPIGIERGYIDRRAARERVLATLRFFADADNEHGFFFHFLDLKSGERTRRSEISTIDTTLLLAGVLFCQSYFDADEASEREIRNLADEIYRRVDWNWAQNHAPAISMGWNPEQGFLSADWLGYDEAMILYVLALGSPTHPVGPEAWRAWTSTYDKHWGTLYGQTHLSFGPLFGHQYSHVWIDFRGIRDDWMRRRDLDYFENSRRATLAQRSYAIENPMHWLMYGENVWGLTACDGPGRRARAAGSERRFYSYAARGVGLEGVLDDGTIAPTAALGSLPFAPEIVIPAAHEMYQRFGAAIYAAYGFRDAFNPTVIDPAQPAASGEAGWVDRDYIGIDEGPILAMIENYRSGLVWRVMRDNPYIRRGLERGGFAGGWLDKGGASMKERSDVSPAWR